MSGGSYTDPLDDDPAEEFDGPSYDEILGAGTRRRGPASPNGRSRVAVVVVAIALLGAAALAWRVVAPEREQTAVLTEPAPTVSAVPVTPSPTAPAFGPATDAPEPFVMRGSGNLTFDVRFPENGLATVRVTADRGRFRLIEIDELDIRTATLAVGQGPYEGIEVSRGDADAHRWRVEATGSWTVEVASVRSAQVRQAPFSGNGAAAFWYVGEAGIAEVTSAATRPGEWVRVTTYGADERPAPVALLTRKETERVRWPAGPVLVLVRAEAPWRLAVRAI